MRKKIFLYLIISLFYFFSLIFFYLVYLKSFPDFPIVLKKDEFLKGVLIERKNFFYFLLIPFCFLLINTFLMVIFKKKKIQFPDIFLFFKIVNLIILFLTFLFSLQVYLLNV